MRIGVVVAVLLAGALSCSAFGGDTSSSSSSGGGSTNADAGASTAGGQLGILCEDPLRCTGADKCCVIPTRVNSCAQQCGDTSAAPVACDDTADCAALGLICCVQRQDFTLFGASCKSACSGMELRACSVASECGPGKGCVPYRSVLNGNLNPDFAFLVCEP